MSDKINIDNPSFVSSTQSSKVDRWAWLKNISNKILRRSAASSEQVTNLGETSKVTASTDTPVDEEQFSPAALLTPSEPTKEPKLEERQAKEPELDRRVEEIPVVKRVLNIGHTLQEELAKTDINVPEIETKGVPAIIGTNETIGNSFFEAIQAKHPDGYLIGVGSGSAYSMLHVFEDGVTPKGVVLTDIDPRVIATGRLLIQNLKESPTATDFERSFFGMSEETFNQQLQNMIAAEQNPVLKRRWATISMETWHKVWTDLSKREVLEWEDIRAYKYEGENIDVIGAVLARFDTLKQLADEDNLTMVYTDFTSPVFIGAVKQLPGFNDSTNVIYFSNISDHITQRGTQMDNIKAMNSLKDYENSEYPAIFIDTLGQGLNYFLRARNSVANFTEEDFRYRGLQPRSKKPEGLLFADISSNS
ncbi:hypothetical protein HYW43_01380 [Candidatus Daviesbacteria bacterium]|nr:hypothetical protein [Candidatus Daviesbacteria bacterium]